MFSRTVSSLIRSCGYKRSEVVEQDLVARFLGRLKVDGLDLDQREILFAFVRGPHLAADGVAGFQIELADLRGRNINVIRTGQVVVIGGAEKAIAIRQDFQNTFGKNMAFFFALSLEDLEDEVLLAQAAGAGQLEGPSNFCQLGDVFFF